METAPNAPTVHPVELCVYSILSTDLDGIYQAINELKESQAILILELRRIRDCLKREHALLYEASDLKEMNEKLESLVRRADIVLQRFKLLAQRSENLSA